MIPCIYYRPLGHLSSRLGILFRNSTDKVALHLLRYEVLIEIFDFLVLYHLA